MKTPRTTGFGLVDLKPELLKALGAHSVVLSAPTGTGKSTEVPRWFAGSVLVIEPRRLACRALAKRVAHLQGSSLGTEVGYRVRHERCASDTTRILFITPGILLQDPTFVEQFDTVVIDEFHERRIDTDWICADLQSRGRSFLVMSATMDGNRVAKHLGGVHFEAQAQSYPVEVSYRADTATSSPSSKDLASRVFNAVAQVESLDGDVLVFLPGKSEIGRCAARFANSNWEVVQLHGGLSLEAQGAAFRKSERSKLILSTNVAETSVTLPDVRCVVDSGLVRRTSYHDGRAHLVSTSVAKDSSAQRTGRAGRTAPGVCIRLWGAAFALEERTHPEIHRETLHEMLLWSAIAKRNVAQMPWLDPPKPYALEAAQRELTALGALDESGRATRTGHELHRLPLDARLGRLLVEARVSGQLPAMTELVALLAHQPPIALARPDLGDSADACDAMALLDWLHEKGMQGAARATQRRVLLELKVLQRALGTKAHVGPIDRRALLSTVIRADPRSAYIARRRKREVAWSAGGTELSLGQESWAQLATDGRALVVLHSLATGVGRERRLLATRACSVPLSWLAAAELGEVKVSRAKRKSGKLLARVERVYAGQILSEKEQEVRGSAARSATCQLYLEGRFLRRAFEESQRRQARWALLPALAADARFAHLCAGDYRAPSHLPEWVATKLGELGVEGGEDLELLSEEDLTLPDVPQEIASTLDEQFPLRVDSGDCLYAVEYDLDKRQVLLTIVKGSRNKPPPAAFLPAFGGFRVCVEAGGGLHVVRAHGRRR